MTLVFAGVCSHAPGIVGRADQADPSAKDRLYEAFDDMRRQLEDSKPDALIIVAAAQGNEQAMANRDVVADELTRAQLARAQKMATRCFDSNYKDCGR